VVGLEAPGASFGSETWDLWDWCSHLAGPRLRETRWICRVVANPIAVTWGFAPSTSCAPADRAGLAGLGQGVGDTLAPRWYTWPMPTALPRYQVTETPPVRRAIDLAAQRWPDKPRSKLLLDVIGAGARSLELELDQAQLEHAHRVEAAAGCLTGAFGPGYLQNLRQDWPE